MDDVLQILRAEAGKCSFFNHVTDKRSVDETQWTSALGRQLLRQRPLQLSCLKLHTTLDEQLDPLVAAATKMQ